MSRPALFRLNALLAALLVLFYVAWWWASGMPRAPMPLTVFVIAAGSMLALIVPLWRGDRFGTSLAGFIAPFHLAFAIMELVASPAVRGWVAVQTFLALLLFIFVMASLRQVRAPTLAGK